MYTAIAHGQRVRRCTSRHRQLAVPTDRSYFCVLTHTQLPLRRLPAACPAILAHTQGDSLACRAQMARGNVECTESAMNCVSCSVFLVLRSAKLSIHMPIIWKHTCSVRCNGLHQAASRPKHHFEALLACRALLKISTVPSRRK